jgi:hypothetical protein
LDLSENSRFQGHARKKPESGRCESTFEHSDLFSACQMCTSMHSYQQVETILHWSFFEMPGKTARHEKWDNYFGTEGVQQEREQTKI